MNDIIKFSKQALLVALLTIIPIPGSYAQDKLETPASPCNNSDNTIRNSIGNNPLDSNNINDNIKYLKAAFKPEQSEQFPPIFNEKKWKKLDLITAAKKAMKRNIAILQAHGYKKIAEAAFQKAIAIFDPIFTLSFNYYQNKVFTREENVKQWKKNTTSYLNDPNPVYIDLPETSPVAYIKYDKERKRGYYDREVMASEKIPYIPDQTRTYRAAVNNNVPWGANIELSLQVQEIESYWEISRDIWGSYERPWRSSIFESISMPFPWSKGFGPYSFPDYQVKKAGYENQATYWGIQILFNDTLLAVEFTYWNLLESIQTLMAIIKHRETIDHLLRRTQSLYDDRMATEYDLAQVKAQLSRSKEREQGAKHRFILFSNRLNELLDADENLIYIPLEKTGTDANELSSILKEDSLINIKENPELMRQAIMIQSARLLEKHKNLQKRPAIKLVQTLSLDQTTSIFGFRSAYDSFKNVFSNPDRIRQIYSLIARYPYLNRAAESAFEKARLKSERELVLMESVKKQILREIQDSVVGLSSSKHRINITCRSLELARLAYKKATAYQETRDVSEYEIVIKSSEMLNAELAFIKSRIENKKVKARLLGSLGKLTEHYSKKRLISNPALEERDISKNISTPHAAVN